MSGSTSHHDHDHDHDHDYDHQHGHGHSHAPRVTADNERKLKLVFALTFGYAIVQAVGGWWSGSLALIADSGHMVSDAAALLLALVAYRVAAKAANARFTYGFHRVRILAALTNGVALLLPLTFTMSPTSAIILLSCMYWGALFGGSITSILFNIHGEPS